MATRLADRLSAARHRRFVGRSDERSLFEVALTAAELPFFILHIFGPGGIGKTSLLHEFTHICNQKQIPAAYIDARDLEPTPESFLTALQAMPAPANSSTSLYEFLIACPRRCVLMIDTYETLLPLDGWFRHEFLPLLSDNVLTVLAGREPPSLAWRTDPGWQTLLRILSLRNLNRNESQTYLTNHHVPPNQHQDILEFTHGHPLALSLITDMFAQHHDIDLQSQSSPDVIKILLEQLVEQVPSPAHRVTLEICAIMRVTTEALLAEMLGEADPSSPLTPDVHELFEWLRNLSFIEADEAGLFPHDLVREILVADLRWRNADWYTELHHRARTYYDRRLQQASSPTQQQLVLSDYIFLHRDNPIVQPYYQWQIDHNLLPHKMRETDRLDLITMVAKHEGETSADLAAYWFDRQPDGVLVFRDPSDQPAGFLAMVALHQLIPEDLRTDPAVRAAHHYLEHNAPLRAGEKATFFRFWLAHDTYQAVSPIQTLVFLNAVRHYLTTPGLAFTFFACAEPDFWLPAFTYADLKRIADADFVVEGRPYGVYGHDWRAVPPSAWLTLLAERQSMTEIEIVASPPAAKPLVVLSRPDFELAVRQALQDLRTTHPVTFSGNPLLQSRLIADRAEPGAGDIEQAELLQNLIKGAANALQASPRDLKFYRVLYHTYFHPAPTQEQAAELLELPFSTYRRYLKSGITRITEILWQQEIGGLKKEHKLNKE